jgi:hypothetical protein
LPHLTWDNNPQRLPWSGALLQFVGLRKAQLDQADVESFCPGYASAPASQQEHFWAELVIAMAWYESSWRVDAVFHEPPALSVDSIGLLQLSYEDEPLYHLRHLDPAIAAQSLKNPIVNLECGLAILSHWVAKDGVIAHSEGRRHTGGARYWSVLRRRRKFKEIRRWARKAAGFSTPP